MLVTLTFFGKYIPQNKLESDDFDVPVTRECRRKKSSQPPKLLPAKSFLPVLQQPRARQTRRRGSCSGTRGAKEQGAAVHVRSRQDVDRRASIRNVSWATTR
jgi:hypothetical protein